MFNNDDPGSLSADGSDCITFDCFAGFLTTISETIHPSGISLTRAYVSVIWTFVLESSWEAYLSSYGRAVGCIIRTPPCPHLEVFVLLSDALSAMLVEVGIQCSL